MIDALLGTGATGEPRGEIAEAVALSASAPVLAVDVPSGVDASTGEVAGVAVRAQATVTFHAAKPGLWIEPGRSHAGVVVVADIGIPDGAPVAFAGGPGARRRARARSRVATSRSTKFTSGRVLVAGGSPGLTGAPCLAALAAARAGAGYVTVCAPARARRDLRVASCSSTMTLALPDEGGVHGPAGVGGARRGCAARAAERSCSGPGLGRGAVRGGVRARGRGAPSSCRSCSTPTA